MTLLTVMTNVTYQWVNQRDLAEITTETLTAQDALDHMSIAVLSMHADLLRHVEGDPQAAADYLLDFQDYEEARADLASTEVSKDPAVELIDEAVRLFHSNGSSEVLEHYDIQASARQVTAVARFMSGPSTGLHQALEASEAELIEVAPSQADRLLAGLKDLRLQVTRMDLALLRHQAGEETGREEHTVASIQARAVLGRLFRQLDDETHGVAAALPSRLGRYEEEAEIVFQQVDTTSRQNARHTASTEGRHKLEAILALITDLRGRHQPTQVRLLDGIAARSLRANALGVIGWVIALGLLIHAREAMRQHLFRPLGLVRSELGQIRASNCAAIVDHDWPPGTEEVRLLGEAVADLCQDLARDAERREELFEQVEQTHVDELLSAYDNLSVIDEELRRTLVALENKSTEIDQVVHIIWHDLQEQVKKIHSYCEILIEAAPDCTQLGMERKYLDRIGSNAERLSRLIIDLQELTSLDKLEAPVETTSLHQVLHRVLDRRADELDQEGRALNLAQLPTIECRPALLERLFDQLLDNAIRYSGAGHTITVEMVSEDENFIAFVFSNQRHARSLTEEVLGGEVSGGSSRLLLPFVRASGEHQGSGVGLAICKKIIAVHDGTISIDASNSSEFRVKIGLPTYQTATADLHGRRNRTDESPAIPQLLESNS